PMPNLRAARKSHTGGHAIVPEQFGGSANSEFELLAGMSQSFLPQGSLPYRQYVRRPIPSLPRALHEVGYVTTAIQADPRYFYDRERVYPLLGFDRVVWAEDGVEAERKSRVGYPVDDVLVDAVIEASRGPRPFFIFAFPSSTHGPYDTGAYRASDLEVVDTLESTAAEEIKEYITALSAADRAIGTLIEHFSSQRDSTIIVVVGDHLPPLSQSALRHLEGHETATDAREAAILVPHRVPLLVWTSFGLPREEPELGLNVLASYILERMGLPRAGLLAVTDSILRYLPAIFGNYARDDNGAVWHRDSLPGRLPDLLHDYWTIQYDLLLGRRYSLGAAAR
ncbi:MAG: LTA synthase family protein, partial [Gemmatimonadota bacterium]|nr:LTA synthase family protein [Gemmatimonadota bacterium]